MVPFVDHRGGMERLALGSARDLARRGFATRILSCRHAREARIDTAGGLPIERRPVLQRGPLLDWTWIVPQALSLAARGKRVRAVIAHQLATSGALAGVASLFSKIPFATVAHGAGRHGDAALLGRLPARRRRVALINRARLVASPSGEIDRELRAAGIEGDKIVRVANGCDVERFRPASDAERDAARRELELDLEGDVVVFVGRLAAEKRVGVLARAVAERPGTTLLVVGDGPCRAALERDADPRRVRLLGSLSDVRPALAAADVFALASESEGASVALLEAMASGLAVAVSDLPANLALVDDGRTGRVVRPGADPSAWTRTFDELFRGRALRRTLGNAARAEVERSYDIARAHGFWADWLGGL